MGNGWASSSSNSNASQRDNNSKTIPENNEIHVCLEKYLRIVRNFFDEDEACTFVFFGVLRSETYIHSLQTRLAFEISKDFDVNQEVCMKLLLHGGKNLRSLPFVVDLVSRHTTVELENFLRVPPSSSGLNSSMDSKEEDDTSLQDVQIGRGGDGDSVSFLKSEYVPSGSEKSEDEEYVPSGSSEDEEYVPSGSSEDEEYVFEFRENLACVVGVNRSAILR